MEFKVGADPELFVRNKKTGVFVSAHEMCEGTKEKPMPVAHGGIQVDGTALEFNVNPAKTAKEFVRNINSVKKDMCKLIPAYHELVASPSVKYSAKDWRAIPKAAKVLGCDPDFNAYTGEVNPPPKVKGSLRVGGGHVHLGWTEGADPMEEGHFESCVWMAKQFDSVIGLQSLLLDKDDVRRSMYGQAGAFRPKPYGFEYRTLSNHWTDDPEVAEGIFKLSKWSAQQLLNGTHIWEKVKVWYGHNIQDVINKPNRGAAKNIVKWLKQDFGMPLISKKVLG